MTDREFLDFLPDGVAEKLGHYVYLYVDPRSDRPFYVGKGKGSRIFAHLSDSGASEKTRTIAELKDAGLMPRLEVLAHGLPDEETALRIEAAAIDLLGLSQLTNAVSGWRSLQMGRMTLDELGSYYAARELTVEHPALLIRINRLYRHNMSAAELYETTRGVWKIGERRARVRYAFAVFEGVVREVYEIHSWHPGHSTPYEFREQELTERNLARRWEFLGTVAPDDVRSLYRGGSVRSYLPRGLQSPFVYVNA